MNSAVGSPARAHSQSQLFPDNIFDISLRLNPVSRGRDFLIRNTYYMLALL